MPAVPPDQLSPWGGSASSNIKKYPKKYLTGPEVCARYGVTSMSLWRWLQDPDLGFPQPTLRIKERRYWEEAELVAWERASATRRARPRRRLPRRRGAEA
jgi:predicted DNA-binding transcriptional regulator AlpA